MIIEFTLNGKHVRIDVDPAGRLVDTLRDEFSLHRTKAGCYSGDCGSCALLFDGNLVHSCLIPNFRIRHHNITTIEGIAATRTYKDLVGAFQEAGYVPCNNCYQAKLLSMYHLLETLEAPIQSEIDEVLLAQTCRCTNHGDLSNIVSNLLVERRKRQRAILR